MFDVRKTLLERFVDYTTYDTMSNEHKVGLVRPTTPGQVVLQNHLMDQLKELGLEVYYGKESVVKGTLKGNCKGKTIGFMAHVDTADDVPGNGVKAQIHENYDGSDLVLKGGTVIEASKNPGLAKFIGSTIITSDGTTLLGADDKAGVAIIMEALRYLKDHPEIKHPDIEVYFTPDEETGSGMNMFPYDRLNSYCCYTFDGGEEPLIELECFNAASVLIKIKGTSYHLGAARGRMVNALTIAAQIISSLPQAESPEATDGRYGYYSVLELNGTNTECDMAVYIRDHDAAEFERRIEVVKALTNALSAAYKGSAEIDVKVRYRNMNEANRKKPDSIEALKVAGKELGLEVEEAIIRGGTDGARMAEKGIACPNLFTGGRNYHSLYEWVALDAMNEAVNYMVAIAGYWCGK